MLFRSTGESSIAAYFSEHFLEAIASSVWGKLYKREMIAHRFDRSVTMGEDLLFNLAYIRKAQKVRAIGESFYLYNRGNVNSLVNNYKLSYYAQDMYVTQTWLSWVGEFPSIEDANLYYRISRAFFCSLQIVCSTENLKTCIEKIKLMAEDELFIAIKKTIHRYNLLQKRIFRALLHENYTMVVILGKFYVWLKGCRRGR